MAISTQSRFMLCSFATSAAAHVALIGLLAGAGSSLTPAKSPGRRVIRVQVAGAIPQPRQQVTRIDSRQPSRDTAEQPQPLEPQPVDGRPRSPRQLRTVSTTRPAHHLPEELAQRELGPPASRRAAAQRPQPQQPPREQATSAARRLASPAATAIAAQVPGETTPAEAVYNPPPSYPPQSLAAGHQGEVLLKVTISKTGRVLDISLLRSSGHRRLDEAARTAVLRWRFTPARRNGQPIQWSAKLPVRFRVQ